MVTVRLVDIIGEDVGSFLDGLPQNEEDVLVEINSPGGDVFSGFAIYNKLKDLKGKVTVDILGLAASAASLIAMAGEEILMRKNSRMMIHNPFTGRFGDAKKFEKTAEELRDITEQLVNIYSERTGISVEKITKMMDDETWLTAEEAVKKNFATKILDKAKEKAKNFLDKFKDLGFKNIPHEYLTGEFSTEPFEIENFNDLPADTSNVNVMRFILAFTDDENIKNKYEQFKKQHPEYNKKIELKLGGHVYLFNDKEIIMLQQILNKLGIEKAEDALAKIDELKKESVTTSGYVAVTGLKPDPEVQNLITAQNEKIELFKTELASKDGTIGELTTQVKAATDFIKNQKTEKRKEVLNGLLGKFMNAAQLEVAEANYLSMPDEAFQATVDFIKAGGEVHKDLTKLKGSGADGKGQTTYTTSDDKGTAVAQEVDSKVKELKDKNKELKFQEALNILDEKEPELMERYYNGE